MKHDNAMCRSNMLHNTVEGPLGNCFASSFEVSGRGDGGLSFLVLGQKRIPSDQRKLASGIWVSLDEVRRVENSGEGKESLTER